MKKAFISCIIMVAVSVVGSAQFFVEGGLSVEFDDATPVFPGYLPEKQYTLSNLNVSPLVGYQLNDDFAVGAKTSFNRRKEWSLYVGTDPVGFEEILSRWNFGVFCRYKIWGTEKLSFLVESTIQIGGSKTNEKKASVTRKIESRKSFGFNINPLVSYEISDKWSIITSYHLFNFGFKHETAKNEETGLKNYFYSYGFYAVSSLSNPLSGIKIGFIYHF